MNLFFKSVLLSCLLSLFVFGELAMGQPWRNPNVAAQPRDIYYKGVKLGVDTPLHILKEAFDAEPIVINQRTGDMDFSVMYAAQFYLAQCQLLGYNGVPKDEKKAEEEFWELFVHMFIGLENMERWTGNAIDSSGRFQRIVSPPPVNVSFKELMAKYIEDVRKKAEQGNAEEQTKLGTYYVLAMGVPSDPRESVKWIRQAAGKGNAKAQYALATYYAGGYGGLPVSRPEFERWIRRAAAQRNEDAQMWVADVRGNQRPPELQHIPPPIQYQPPSNSGNTRGGAVNTSQSFRLAVGDVILEINGERINRQEDVTSAIARSPQTMYFTVRDGRTGVTARYVTTLSPNRPRFGMTHQTNPGGGSRVTGVNANAPRIYLAE